MFNASDFFFLVNPRREKKGKNALFRWEERREKNVLSLFFCRLITSAKHSDHPPNKRLANFLFVSIDFSRGFGRNHLSAPWGGEGSLWGIPQTSGGHDGHLHACALKPIDRQQLSREITFQLLIILLHVGGKKA